MKQERLKIVMLTAMLYSVLFLLGLLWVASSDPEIREVSVPGPTVTVETPGPVKTKIVQTPGPTVTVRATERASRSSTNRASSSTKDTLACIRKHESTNNYRAASASGTYRGAYQMSIQYSDTWAERAGFGEWADKPADKWPPAVQDAVAAHMGRSGWGHWSKHTSYSCPGF